MALFITVFWVLYLVIILLSIIKYVFHKPIKQDYFMYIIIVAIPFLILAILVDDPIFQSVGLPKEYEWLATMIMGGFSLWKFYLDPLKTRVTALEKSMSEGFAKIYTVLDYIKNDLFELKQEMHSMKKEMTSMNNRITNIENAL